MNNRRAVRANTGRGVWQERAWVYMAAPTDPIQDSLALLISLPPHESQGSLCARHLLNSAPHSSHPQVTPRSYPGHTQVIPRYDPGHTQPLARTTALEATPAAPLVLPLVPCLAADLAAGRRFRGGVSTVDSLSSPTSIAYSWARVLRRLVPRALPPLSPGLPWL